MQLNDKMTTFECRADLNGPEIFQVEESQASILIELRSLPKSLLEVEQNALLAFNEMKNRPEVAGCTEAQLADLYHSIENAIFEVWIKRSVSRRIIGRTERALSKIRQSLKNLGERYDETGVT